MTKDTWTSGSIRLQILPKAKIRKILAITSESAFSYDALDQKMLTYASFLYVDLSISHSNF